MKLLKIMIVGFLLLSINSYSQFYPGLDRRLGGPTSNQQVPKQPTSKEIEEHRNELIDRQMLILNNELKLDDLQFIAIKNEIVKNYKAVDILYKKEFSDEEKNNQMKAIQESSEKTILSYLSPEQKTKYLDLQKEKPKKKEDKKKKKDTEKESETNN
jgi:hypothetical protein